MIAIDDLKYRAMTALELADEAERTLIEAVPKAAKFLVAAAERAALKGDSRPAETILQQVNLPGPDGKPRRMLEPPARRYDHEHGSGAGPQIIVGVSVGSLAGSESLRAEPINVLATARVSSDVIDLTPSVKDLTLVRAGTLGSPGTPQPVALCPDTPDDRPLDSD